MCRRSRRYSAPPAQASHRPAPAPDLHLQTRGRKDSGLGTESPDGSTMALVASPDLQNETKYSLVKNKIVKAATPELAEVLIHSNGIPQIGLGETGEGKDVKKDEADGDRKASARAASTPASQSSPRPKSSISHASQGLHKEEDEKELQLDKSEQLSITSATDNEIGEDGTDREDDDDDVVVTPGVSRPASGKSAKSLIQAATYQPESSIQEIEAPPKPSTGNLTRPVSAKSDNAEAETLLDESPRPKSDISPRAQLENAKETSAAIEETPAATVAKATVIEGSKSLSLSSSPLPQSRPSSAKEGPGLEGSSPRPGSANSAGSRRASDQGSQHSLRSGLASGVSTAHLEAADEIVDKEVDSDSGKETKTATSSEEKAEPVVESETKSIFGEPNEQGQHVPNLVEEREQVKSSGGKPEGESGNEDNKEVSPKEENTTSMTSATKSEDESHDKVTPKGSVLNSAKSSRAESAKSLAGGSTRTVSRASSRGDVQDDQELNDSSRTEPRTSSATSKKSIGDAKEDLGKSNAFSAQSTDTRANEENNKNDSKSASSVSSSKSDSKENVTETMIISKEKGNKEDNEGVVKEVSRVASAKSRLPSANSTSSRASSAKSNASKASPDVSRASSAKSDTSKASSAKSDSSKDSSTKSSNSNASAGGSESSTPKASRSSSPDMTLESSPAENLASVSKGSSRAPSAKSAATLHIGSAR